MVKLDVDRFRFCQGFVDKSFASRRGVRVDPFGYWATNGRVLVAAPCATGIRPPGETIVVPPLSRYANSIEWHEEGRWLEVTGLTGKKGKKIATRTRYHAVEPPGKFPSVTVLTKMVSNPLTPMTEALIDTGMLSLFPGNIRIVFHGSAQPIEVLPLDEGKFEWAGIIMGLSGWNSCATFSAVARRMIGNIGSSDTAEAESFDPPHPTMQRVEQPPA